MTGDLFLRAHVVPRRRTRRRRRPRPTGPTWPEECVVFDTETTIDTQQGLILGVFRRCCLTDDGYRTFEEGLIHADDASASDRRVIERYARRARPASDVRTFPPRLKLTVLSRAAFVERVLWRAAQRGHLIVGFNLPFDLSRLAVEWRTARNGGWSLILSHHRSRKTGRIEPNPYRPRIRVTARTSRSAFLSLQLPAEPEEWPFAGRFLDLHTLADALYDESYSLNRLCRQLKIRGKLTHEPSGRVTAREIAYCREDVRATADVLNALKREFDRHPIDLLPDRAYSAAAIAKAYLDAMGLVPPAKKFKIPHRVLGIAMEAYYGGRAECRTRRQELPVMLTDFKSQYPTVNADLGIWRALVAKSLTFTDATREVRALLAKVTLDQTFAPEFWGRLSFFALVWPDRGVLPVRSVYNGETRNIGVNQLTSVRPVWIAGPDLVADVLLSGKVPHIEEAIRMVPHGVQRGLKSVALRGGAVVDPLTDDLFRRLVEQRELCKASDPPLAKFLKTMANAGSYGTFVEVTPKVHPKPVWVTRMEGTRKRRRRSFIEEVHGRLYCPPIGALITAGGRLLLAMLERSVVDAGGTYLFCDTDSLCIIAARRAHLIPCDGGPHRLRGRAAIKALSHAEVRAIVRRFAALNPFDPARVPGSILKIEAVNTDRRGRSRRVLGFAISAKRYALYTRRGRRIIMLAPKAHGLGYLYPPNSPARRDDPPWTEEAWDWMVRGELRLPRRAPRWLRRPAMMRITANTPGVLARLRDHTRPFSFLLCPILDPAMGYPMGADPNHFTVVMPFSKHADRWWGHACVNIHDGRSYQLSPHQRRQLDRVIPQTLESVLRAYARHPESKSLGPDGQPCGAETHGLLQRTKVVERDRFYVEKETDRKWEDGEDLSLLASSRARPDAPGQMVIASVALRKEIRAVGIREMMRLTKLSQHTIEKALRGEPVRPRTLEQIIRATTAHGGSHETSVRQASAQSSPTAPRPRHPLTSPARKRNSRSSQ